MDMEIFLQYYIGRDYQTTVSITFPGNLSPCACQSEYILYLTSRNVVSGGPNSNARGSSLNVQHPNQIEM